MPSYEKRNSTWSVRFRTFDENGKEKNMRLSGYSTKYDARFAYEKYIAENPFSRPKRQKSDAPHLDSFEQLVAEFLAFKKPHIAESSFIDMQNRLNKHILPFFKKRKPDTITVADIEKWQDALSQKGYAIAYLKNIRSYLKQIFDLAKRRYRIPNPTSDALDVFKGRSKKRQNSKMQIWTESEFNRFIQAIDDETSPKLKQANVFRAFFKFLFETGCRRGEALALTKQDIGSKNNPSDPDADLYVCINKSLSYKTQGQTYAITNTKTDSSVREVYIPRALKQELLALPDNKFLFGVNGKPLPENAISRKFQRWTDAAGLKQIRIHDLRHSHASFLISNGIPITAVSHRLGHASVKETLDTYAHLLPKDEDRVKSLVACLHIL